MRSSRRTATLLAGTLLLLSACQQLEDVLPERAPPESPREAYFLGLEEAGLAQTALGRDWQAAGRGALASAVPVTLPYREARYLPPHEPQALAYRFAGRRGQRLEVTVSPEAERVHRVFIDLYRAPPGAGEAAVRLGASEDDAWGLEHDVRRDGDYIVRIQPELLRGGRYTVTLRLGPSLAFPVHGRAPDAIGSRFGAPRDGGRRDHHGVDIFAPRGTPALAATEALVSRVDTTPRGGRVVWLRDARAGQSLYYAHLDEPLVRAGQRVAAGDTVGLIGNTGNARTTPPHLHFGIYSRGPVDPWPFLYHPAGELPRIPDQVEGIGAWRRLAADAELHESPGRSEGQTLARGSVVRLTGVSGRWYAAQAPDGRVGYLLRSSLESGPRPLETERLATPAPLFARPVGHPVVVDSLPQGEEVSVLGHFAEFLLVRTEGREGWLRGDALGRAAAVGAGAQR